MVQACCHKKNIRMSGPNIYALTFRDSDKYGIQFTDGQIMALTDMEKICHETDMDDIDKASQAKVEAQVQKLSVELIRVM